MAEISDLKETDAENTSLGSYSLDGNVANMSTMDDVLQAILGMLKRWFKSSLFRLRDSTDQTKLLAFDLSELTTATTRTVKLPDRSGTMSLTSDITSRRNRIVNHDMRMSQENGTSSGTSNGYYAADQWATYRVTSAGTITSAQVASVTPAGSPNRYRVTITTADSSLAAGEYLTITQNLEGSNVADFRYGSASAKASVLRFGFKGPAGTYAVALHNSGATRSYVALFTISSGEANTDTVQTIAIPGDTSGTWLTADGVIGITLDIVLACGSTFQGTTGWQAGNVLGTSAVSNGMGTGSAVFELFDVGLRLDPDATGVYGQYEVGEVHPVYRSERYYFVGRPVANVAIGFGVALLTTEVRWFLPLPAPLARSPGLSGFNTMGVRGGGSSRNAASNSASIFPGVSGVFVQTTVSGGTVSENQDYAITSDKPYFVIARLS